MIMRILKNNEASGNYFSSHISMYNPTGTYIFDNDTREEFLDVFCRYMEKDKNIGTLGIAENPQDYYPVIADIDIKLEESLVDPFIVEKFKARNGNIIEHLYEEKHIIQTIEIIQNILREVLDEKDPNLLICAVLEKNIYKIEKGGVNYYKNGFHLHFPYVFLTKREHEKFVNVRIRETLKNFEVFSDIGYEDSARVFDSIANKSWLMYGCRKNKVNDKPYVLTSIYDGSLHKISLEEAFKYYDIFDKHNILIHVCGKERFYLPRILSIVPYGRSICHISRSVEESLYLAKQSNRKKRNSIYKSNIEEDINLAEKLISLLLPFRSEDHDEWMRIGWILYNISEGAQEGLDLWISFSSKSCINFDEDECYKRWDNMALGDYTIGSLKYIAKEDNPSGYRDLIAEVSKKYLMSDGTHTDIAKLMFSLFGNEFICSSISNKVWYQFINHYWQEVEDGVTLRLRIPNEIGPMYGKIGQEAYTRANCEVNKNNNDVKNDRKKADYVQRIVQNLNTTPFIKNIMTAACDIFYYDKFRTKLNTDPYLFGFRNGVYDLKKNVFRIGKPDDYMTRHTSINYREYSYQDKEVLEVLEFLEKIFPDTTVRTFFLDQMSDVFVGGNFQKVAVFWTGDGDNGKSITMLLIEHMLGDYAIKFNTTVITGKKVGNGQADPELSRAGDAVRLAVLEEPDNTEKINIGTFKKLTGNDKILARDLFESGKNMREIVPMFKFIFIANGLPEIPGSDQAFWNRVLVCPFESNFVKQGCHCPKTYEEQLRKKIFPQDPNIQYKLKKMAPALAWLLLEHRKKIQGQTRIIPEKVKLATDTYKRRNDMYRQYIEDRITVADNQLKMDQIYEEFRVWYRSSFSGNNCPDKNVVKEYFVKIWGKPLAGDSWIGFRMRTADDDLKETVLYKVNEDDNDEDDNDEDDNYEDDNDEEIAIFD